MQVYSTIPLTDPRPERTMKTAEVRNLAFRLGKELDRVEAQFFPPTLRPISMDERDAQIYWEESYGNTYERQRDLEVELENRREDEFDRRRRVCLA